MGTRKWIRKPHFILKEGIIWIALILSHGFETCIFCEYKLLEYVFGMLRLIWWRFSQVLSEIVTPFEFLGVKLLYLHPSKPLKQYISYDKLCFQIFKVQSTSHIDKYLSTCTNNTVQIEMKWRNKMKVAYI